ncbi:MAG: hypothetical protein HXY20_14180 [Acidobacteria bacterium]|nr:hypothetical protein [Acidobacteriota bacterium]
MSYKSLDFRITVIRPPIYLTAANLTRHTSTLVILRVDAAAAHTAGIDFYHPTAAIYLVESLPPEYLNQ